MNKSEYERSIFVSHFKQFKYQLLSKPYIEICNIQDQQEISNFSNLAQGLNRIGLENQTFGELATLYEKWSLSQLTDMVGLFHYRRFLVFNPESLEGCQVSSKFWEGDYRNSWNYRFQIMQDQIESISFYDNKLVLPKPRLIKSGQSIWEDFIVAHPNLKVLLKQVCDAWEIRFPGSNIENWLKSNHTMFLFNIFYGPRDFVEEWCKAIFPILIKIDESLNLNERGNYSRWAGYVSERIFSFYVQQQSILTKYEIVYLPVIHFKELEYEAKVNNLEFQLKNAEREILGFVNSKSWKLTRPVRSLSKFIQNLLNKRTS